MGYGHLAPLIPQLMEGDMVSILKNVLLSTLKDNPHLQPEDKSFLDSALRAENIQDTLLTLASAQKMPLLVNHVRTVLHGPQDQSDPLDVQAQDVLRLLADCPSCGVTHSVAAYLRARHPDELASAQPTTIPEE